MITGDRQTAALAPVLGAERFVEEFTTTAAFLAQHSQFLEPVRLDPRFQQLLDEVRPRWEATVAWERAL